MKRVKQALLYLMGFAYILAGANHFINEPFYTAMMPSYLPWHEALVAISGVIEMLLGVMLFIPRTRRLAGWGVIALLIAVFPANLNMALHAEQFDVDAMALWARLPFQLLFIAWAYWVTKPDRPAEAPRHEVA